MTREVHVVASLDVLGADGTVETITGTTIHPVWSVDRQEWVPLAELADGETLQGLDGLALVLSVSLSRVTQPVYNIDVHGEHVYQVGELGLVVHNSCPLDRLSLTARKTYASLTENIIEHQRRLHDYTQNPLAFDKKGILANVPTQAIKDRIINVRIKHLSGKIHNWERQLAEILNNAK